MAKLWPVMPGRDLHEPADSNGRRAAEAALRAIGETIDWIQTRTNDGDVEKSLALSGVRGFTICPPRGKELSQQQMSSALRGILETRVPIAIYQLPQITQNEMSPEL